MRYRIDGEALKRARYAAGLSLAEFAERAGWSRQRQAKLEHAGAGVLVRAAVLETMLAVLLERGVRTGDRLPQPPDARPPEDVSATSSGSP